MTRTTRREETSRFKTRLRPMAAAILWAGCGTFAGLSEAQEPSADPDEVVTLGSLFVKGEPDQPGQVSSPKFTAPLIDTPQTVQVIPSELFTQQGAQDLTDVLRGTPGISFQAGENGFATNTNSFNLRGFDTTGNIFVDGARDIGSYRRDVFNVEQVEIAKGPAADNGRGAPGGYVNIVTKTPKLQNGYRATVGYGVDEYDSENRLRTTLDLNHVVAPGTATRVNVLMQEGGVAGRKMAEENALGVAPSIAFGLDSPTRLILAYQYLEQNDLPDWGISGAFIKGLITYDPNTDEDDRDNFFGLASDYDDVESHTATVRIEHDFSPTFGLSNQTRWAKNRRNAGFTMPNNYNAGTQQAGTQTYFYNRETEAISNLTNLSIRFDTGSLRHNAAVGLEFSRETSDALRFGTLTQPAVDIANPDPHRVAGTPSLAPTQSAAVEVDTVALYAYDTVELSERWQVTGGIRGERFKAELDSRVIATGDPVGPDDYETDDTTVSGKLGVVFKPREEGNIYGAVSMATLPPGGGNWLTSQDISRTNDNAFPGLAGQNNEEAKTQQAINYEIGSKWSFFDERLYTSVAVFHTERRNVAITGSDNPGDPVVLQGYGKQIVQGIELSAAGQITQGWSAYAGILFLDSERKHSALLDERRRNAAPDDYGTFTSTNGDELAFTPNVSANLWTTYSFRSGLTVGGGILYVDESWVGRPDDADRIIPNGRWGKLPDYTVLNVMASYAVNPNLALRLNIDNITDELYAISTNWQAPRAFVGAPRSYLLTADFRF